MTPSHPLRYFKYSGSSKTELDSSAKGPALPHHFLPPDVPGNDPKLLSGVCSFPSAAPDAPPFWFDFSGNRLAGKFKSTIPSEYFLAPARAHPGLRIQAGFGGAAAGSGVLYETAYFHQQPCDAGGMEFGFYRNVIAAQTVFYISNNSNCGIEPASYCHVSNSFSSAYMNEDNFPGQALKTNINGWVIRLKVPSAELRYSAFLVPDRSAPHGFRFQVEVFDPMTSQQANCDVYDTSGNTLFSDKPCAFPVRPGGWYEMQRLDRPGYVTVGIQRQGDYTVSAAIDFDVKSVAVPK